MEDASDIGLKHQLQLKKKNQGLIQMIVSEFVTVLCWKQNLKHGGGKSATL